MNLDSNAVERRVGLLRAHFLCREDLVGVKSPWGKNPAHPALVAPEDLEDLLRAHVAGGSATLTLRRASKTKKDKEQGEWVLVSWEDVPEGSVIRVSSFSPHGSRTRFIVIDLDGSPDKAKPLQDLAAALLAVVAVIRRAGLTPYVVTSTSGQGYHVWILLEPTSARIARLVGKTLLAQAFVGSSESAEVIRSVEVFPKSPRVGPNGCGSAVRLPWWHGAKGGATGFVAVDEGGVTAPYEPTSFVTHTEGQLRSFLDALGVSGTKRKPTTSSARRSGTKKKGGSRNVKPLPVVPTAMEQLYAGCRIIRLGRDQQEKGEHFERDTKWLLFAALLVHCGQAGVRELEHLDRLVMGDDFDQAEFERTVDSLEAGHSKEVRCSTLAAAFDMERLGCGTGKDPCNFGREGSPSPMRHATVPKIEVAEGTQQTLRTLRAQIERAIKRALSDQVLSGVRVAQDGDERASA